MNYVIRSTVAYDREKSSKGYGFKTVEARDFCFFWIFLMQNAFCVCLFLVYCLAVPELITAS